MSLRWCAASGGLSSQAQSADSASKRCRQASSKFLLCSRWLSSPQNPAIGTFPRPQGLSGHRRRADHFLAAWAIRAAQTGAGGSARSFFQDLLPLAALVAGEVCRQFGVACVTSPVVASCRDSGVAGCFVGASSGSGAGGASAGLVDPSLAPDEWLLHGLGDGGCVPAEDGIGRSQTAF